MNVFSIYSCDDQVDPKAEFNDIYALTCIIRGDTSFQKATLTHSYDVEGFDPLSNTTDPFVKGATIKLIYQSEGKTYTFRDTSFNRLDSSRYKTPVNLYYIKDFKPESNSRIDLEAILPNGQKVTASSTTYFLSDDYIDTNSRLIPFPKTVFGKMLFFDWKRLERRNKIENIYFAPELSVQYFKIENGKKVRYAKEVPASYIGGLTEDYPKYPPLLKDVTEFYFDTLAIRNTIIELSAGDLNKENYHIEGVVFRLFAFDKNFAAYYTSQKIFNEEFSVRVIQPNYSNIDGGLGIFGTVSSAKMDIFLKPDYVRSFGYSYH